MVTSWIAKFKDALVKTSDKISGGLNDIFVHKRLDEEALSKLEELLLSSDMSFNSVTLIKESLKKLKFEPNVGEEKVKEVIFEILKKILLKHDSGIQLSSGLNIFVMCGVNGSGKTTSVGKLAYNFSSQGKKVVLAACDTFRAAAKEQLYEWGQRASCKVIFGKEGADPASVAYSAIEVSLEEKADILIIDTAGRLYNQKNLMDELSKIFRVIKKFDEKAPKESFLVLDGTTGQNAYMQLEIFKNNVPISGLVVTKLDGTAKAGVVVGLVDRFNIPVKYIGIGENKEDLKAFETDSFIKSILGL